MAPPVRRCDFPARRGVTRWRCVFIDAWTVALRASSAASTVERELDDELRFHFDQMAQHGADRGAGADDAYHEARRRFGGMNQVKEACREMRTLRPIEHFFQDLRFGRPAAARSPVFTVVAVLSLALGIGANSAIFSVINAVVLRKLPVESPTSCCWRSPPIATGRASGSPIPSSSACRRRCADGPRSARRARCSRCRWRRRPARDSRGPSPASCSCSPGDASPCFGSSRGSDGCSVPKTTSSLPPAPWR